MVTAKKISRVFEDPVLEAQIQEIFLELESVSPKTSILAVLEELFSENCEDED